MTDHFVQNKETSKVDYSSSNTKEVSNKESQGEWNRNNKKGGKLS